MHEMKVRIDYNVDPNMDNKAKQVVYLEKTLDETDVQNLVGKTISHVEYEPFHNCLILTLVEEMPPYILSDASGSFAIDTELMGNPSASLAPIDFQSNPAGSYENDKNYDGGPK